MLLRPPLNFAGPARSPRWATCSAGGHSISHEVHGATTPQWRSALRTVCLNVTVSMRATRWSVIGAGSNKAIFLRPANALASPPAQRAPSRWRSGGDSRALARALYAALTGQPKAIVIERATLTVAPVTPVEAGSAAEPNPSGSGPVAQRVGSSAPGALAAAVAAFGATDNFRDAILYAVNLG